MKKTKPFLGLLLFLFTIQLFVPASMILRQESILKQGKVFRLKVVPRDPYDAFRGKYVALDFEAASLKTPRALPFAYKEKVFAVLEENAEGFAKVKEVVKKPSKDSFAIPVRFGYSYAPREGETVHNTHLMFPFERFYLEEKTAPQAETVVQNLRTENPQKIHVTLRVKDTAAALEELYIDDQPVYHYFQNAGK